MKTLVAKNPSERRGIAKALRAAGIKFEFRSTGKQARRKKKTRNPAKRKRTRRAASKSARRRKRH